MSGKKYDAVVVGLNVIDILFERPDKITEGEKHEVSRLVIQGGAPAGNAACGLASMGWKTGFVGKLGNNTLSSISRTELQMYNVSESLLIKSEKAQPAIAVVAIDQQGERTVYYSLAGYEKLTPGDIPTEAIKEAGLLLVDGYETEGALEALRIAHKYGIPSVLDIETGDAELMRKAMKLGTDTILPLSGALELTGCETMDAALYELSGWTDGRVIITDGIKGSWTLNEQELIHQPAFSVQAVDTTGCGDAYHAGYASALLDGLPLNLRMEFAAFFASRVALQFGGRTQLPNPASLKAEDLSGLSSELKQYIRNKE
ncbi:carbohydrate kinase family protein [Pontiella agarivorans]|uniref:PfkB family carbohydrate kinase n=1 Tax=Pontiella agarivorans TaxID=3038953 RepID=A0ABU5MWD2_9BACT|nr:PfkB family carbohydrate kinase [Pontiella agarivorans]MDZ8118396.1 PfkB family carbohydrate kinase [Pontiella agarivorans]